VKGPSHFFRTVLIRWNNGWVRRRTRRVAAGEVLVLVAHCLQGGCGRTLGGDGCGCERCGGCDIAALRAICEQYGVRLRIAAGGREAAAVAREASVRAIVAVACDRELVAGLWAAFPKPVLAVPNSQPQGYCRRTRVEVQRVEEVLVRWLGLPAGGDTRTPTLRPA
jgi:hypothetical protein